MTMNNTQMTYIMGVSTNPSRITLPSVPFGQNLTHWCDTQIECQLQALPCMPKHMEALENFNLIDRDICLLMTSYLEPDYILPLGARIHVIELSPLSDIQLLNFGLKIIYPLQRLYQYEYRNNDPLIKTFEIFGFCNVYQVVVRVPSQLKVKRMHFGSERNLPMLNNWAQLNSTTFVNTFAEFKNDPTMFRPIVNVNPFDGTTDLLRTKWLYLHLELAEPYAKNVTIDVQFYCGNILKYVGGCARNFYSY